MSCEICQNWARADVTAPYHIRTRGGMPLVTNHHPNCQHYNDSLIDVWKVTCGDVSYYSNDEQDAQDTAKCETEESGGETVSIVKEQMHREVFENLPEFDGF